MLSYQPDQTAYLLNKLAEGHGGGGGTLYNTTGQHTDGAMTQKATTDALGTKANATDVGNALAGKVDKEVGKGLSSNDFTDADKTKLDGIEAGAQVNVQSDWDQADNTKDDYIKNKPTIPPGVELYNSTGQNTDGAMTQKATTDALNLKVDAVSGKGLSSNDFTDADVSKLSGIEAGAEVNVQADWNQADTSADDYIQNKPTIPGPYTLPPATTSTLGGIIVGNNLTVAADGTLSANGGTLPNNLVYWDAAGTITPVVPYVSTSSIMDDAVTNDKIDWSTLPITNSTTTTITFKTGSTTTGTGTATVIHLNNSGLVALLYQGSTGFGDAGTGSRQISWEYSTAFTTLIGGSVESWYSGDVNAYMTYSSMTLTGGECYVAKSTSVSETRFIRITAIGIMS